MKKIPLIYWTILNLSLIFVMYLTKSKYLSSCFIMGTFTVLLYKYSKYNSISTNKINSLYYFVYCSTLLEALLVLEFLDKHFQLAIFKYISYLVITVLLFYVIKLLYCVGKELDMKRSKRKDKKSFEEKQSIVPSFKTTKKKSR
ncbi:hypothetical protein [Hathewaya limosa]|uniref:Membrane protein n=1 Tax=Hathewaya limosa TaxID=1536 RepID=A0ABU0JPL9_HATLI|nr:hypothetical protein [Hathewaya limosa]MDQ0479032.1 putative membrane protein [Hathewaya limosa]